MKKNTIVRTVLAGIFALFTCGASASDTIPAPAGASVFEMMPFVCPLMGTSNPAALSLGNVSNINLAEAGYLFSNDEVRLVMQPERIMSWNTDTKGYMKLGKLSLFGSFGYSNSGYHGVMYNGTFMFNSLDPYILGDTVPARLFKEQFDMQGKVSYTVTDRIIFGVDAEYQSAVGARVKDPRHKNTISALRITPGVLYDLGKTRLGLSASYYTTSDEIDYKVEGNDKQVLFQFLGLGYRKEAFETSYYSQWYTGQGYSGAVQLDHSNGNTSTIAEVSFKHFKEECRHGSSYRLLNGITWTNKVDLTALLKVEGARAIHLISLKSSYEAANSDEINQQTHLVYLPSGIAYQELEIISWKENKYMVSDINATLSYSYLTFDRTGYPDIDAGVAFNMQYFKAGYYPVETNGFYDFMNAGASLYARKLFRIRSFLLTPGIEAGYRINLSSDISLSFIDRCEPEMVYHDYYISKAGLISTAAYLRIERPFSQNNFVKSLFLIPEARYRTAPDTETGSLTGYMISARAGITF